MFSKAQPGVILYKTTVSSAESFNELDFKRKLKSKFTLMTKKKRYSLTNSIYNDQKKDLLNLLLYISDTFNDFYTN